MRPVMARTGEIRHARKAGCQGTDRKWSDGGKACAGDPCVACGSRRLACRQLAVTGDVPAG